MTRAAAAAVVLIALSSPAPSIDRETLRHLGFYVPENLRYTVVDSALDSLRFTIEKTLREDEKGHLAGISSFVTPDGEIMSWHDFGNLEGPGWAANAVGGAEEIYAFGAFLGRDAWKETARRILDHVLE